MPIRNYTTSIDAGKTVGEIQQMLAKAGAQSVMIDYQDGQATAVAFLMMVAGQPLSFRIRTRPEAILKAMQADKGVQKSYCNIEQATRTAWRITKDWVDVQLAFAEADQADLAKLLLGYAVTNEGRDVYELVVAGEGRRLLSDDFTRT